MSEPALNEQLLTLDASSLAKSIQERKFTSYEIVNAHLERVEKYNQKYNAIVTFNDKAIEKAKEADRALAQGESWGLHKALFLAQH